MSVATAGKRNSQGKRRSPESQSTSCGGPGLYTFGVNVDAFADSIFTRLEKGETEIGYETSELRRLASRQELDAYFVQMNAPRG
jgi:uncharacterized oxidoreductase